jgi:hypothetical protein
MSEKTTPIEATARAIQAYRTSGLCELDKACGLCDCGADVNPEGLAEDARRIRDEARYVLTAGVDAVDLVALVDPTIREPLRSRLIAAWDRSGLDSAKYIAEAEAKAAQRAAAIRAALLEGSDR